jgi:hypothetical protein
MLRKLIFFTLTAAPLVFAQDNASKVSPPDAQAAGGQIRDERVSVENLSFWKKNATDGKGDYLELTFDIVNKTEDSIPLKMFIIGFNEKDLVDGEYRRYVEYPKWRHFDEDKQMHKIVLFNSIPEIKHEDVAAYARKKEETVAKNGGFKPREEPAAPAGAKNKTTLKQFLHYVQYVHEKPESGVDILLQGFEDAKFTRKIEKTYRIEEKALRTNVWGKLLSRYRVDRKFFNHVGLVLYDTEAKKIVHRQFYSIKGRFKIL